MVSSGSALEVVSFGEPMVEFNARTVGRLRDVEVFERGYGGDTSNMAVALAKLSHRCGYMTKLGSDEFGQSLLGLWQSESVDTTHVLFEESAFTGIYFVARTESGRHEFTYYRTGSAASHFEPNDLDMGYVNRARVFHTSGITQAISTSCRNAVERVFDELDRSKVVMAYDPNLRLRLWPLSMAREVILRTMGRSDIVFPSLEDAQALLDIEKPEAVATRMLDLGCSLVILKMGADGCLVADGKEMLRIPGFSVKVTDTTGAGDAFDAGFLAAFLEGKRPRDAAVFANAVAALKCMGNGAITPQPRRNEVECFLKKP